ncbi:MAG: kinase [Clostridia bacterium]|nr:kinase [Clostridia bacterium]
MLIIRTPMRVSFFGGGTDYPAFFNEYSGAVISTTIRKYCYVTLRDLPPLFEYENQLTYSKIEYFNSPSEVRHPLVRAALEYMPTPKIQISYDADMPACAGLGSSSAFAVGLLHGLHEMRGEHPSPMTLAKEAIHLERDLCREAGGVQDQIAVAFGGLNRIDFSRDGYDIKRIEISERAKEDLQNNLLLLFTGFTRFAGIVSVEQNEKLPENIAALKKMNELTDTAQSLLEKGDIALFGELLNDTWQLKRTLSGQITNDEIDRLYKEALECGALGGKLLGAGGGGFLLLYVPKEKQGALRERFSNYEIMPVQFSDSGSDVFYRL